MCSAADSSNPLLVPGILQNVLIFVGPGHCLFVALISRLWRDTYNNLGSQQLKVASGRREQMITCDPQMTLYSSVFASPSRVKLAKKHWLDCNSEAFQLAAGKHADITTLATAHEIGRQMGMPYTVTTMLGAAQNNKLAEVKFLRSQGCPWSSQHLDAAASSGHFELVRWCYEHGCPWSASMPWYAAESGNVELMAWVLQLPGTDLRDSGHTAMSAAASQGHMDMCQYLYSLQWPWNKSSTRQAALGGHIDVLRWLIDNGCAWDLHELAAAAIQGGSIEVLVELQQQDLLNSVPLLTELLDMAVLHNKLAVAKWLREQGAEWPSDTVKRKVIVALARAEGCTSPAK
jgi:Ankyrin repeats (3 copies)